MAKINQPWKTMSDPELLQYTKDMAQADCQSSEWEGIPLNEETLHNQLFEKFKNLRDGK